MRDLVGPIVVFATLGLSLASSSVVAAQDAGVVQKPPITITAFETFGRGCPTGTVTPLPGNSDAKGQAVLLLLDTYEATVNPSKPSESLPCEIRLYLRAPKGIRTALNTIKYDGNALLDPGVQGLLEAFYFWRGQSIETSSATPKRLIGPYDDVFTFQDTVDVRQWSACDSEETLVLQTFLTVTNAQPRRSGAMRVSQTEIDVQSTVRRSIWIEFLSQPCSATTSPTTR